MMALVGAVLLMDSTASCGDGVSGLEGLSVSASSGWLPLSLTPPVRRSLLLFFTTTSAFESSPTASTPSSSRNRIFASFLYIRLYAFSSDAWSAGVSTCVICFTVPIADDALHRLFVPILKSGNIAQLTNAC